MIVLGLTLTSLSVISVHAQDDDLPFEDFPDLESTQDDPLESEENFSDTAEANNSSSADSSAELTEEELDAEFNALESEGDEEVQQAQADQIEVVSPGAEEAELAEETFLEEDFPEEAAPTAPEPLLAQPTNVEESNSNPDDLFGDVNAMPEDIQALEERLREAEELHSGVQTQGGLIEPGSQLPPSEKFWRVPIRPQMSDANWLRWAGPMVDKNYRVHRGDSLWKVSERLFGSPYLWPKIWHLNASITNPHIITKGMKLNFRPGNPGSAPELAYRSEATDEGNVGLYPLTKLEKKKTLLEIIDDTLRQQIGASHPPFQNFLLYSKPDSIGEIPKLFNSSGKIFFREGDSFKTTLADGVFPIATVTPINVEFSTYYRVNWLGTLKIIRNKATVVKAFKEIRAGDLIVNRSFRLTPLAIHEDTIGPEYRKDTRLVPVQVGSEVHAAEHGLVGIRFPAIGVGPRPGALLTVNVGQNAKAKALLIDRDQRTGTLWIVDSQEEVDIEDSFF